MKKRIVAILLSTVMAMSAVACGGTSTASTEFVVEKYEGIEIESVEVLEITSDDVEGYIDMMLSYETTMEEVDRKSKNGDIVNIDYVGTIDGVEFEGGAAEMYDLYLGSGTFIDGFEDQLVGVKAGEDVKVEVTFPSDYGSEDLAGKDAEFAVTVNMVQEQVTPELNSDYVKSVSEVSTTVKEYKVEIEELLIEQNELAAEDGLKSQAWTILIDSVLAQYEPITSVLDEEETEDAKDLKKYPEADIKEVADKIIESITAQATEYGMELSAFVESAGMDEAAFDEYVDTSAKQEYIMKNTVSYIVEKEGLNLDKEDLEAQVYELVANAGFESVEAAQEMGYSQEDLEMNVLTEIVVTWITDNAVVVEPGDEEIEETEEVEESEETEEESDEE